ncbi:VOC family protein [Nonomuraea aridisoli]|uniref:VOC family protein n=1 Tax=Nonomuraea aridisoli TaxID=2070368 RepID=UPI001F266C3A|nr:VOC family protein [Nonomuraea aridisoli]
MVDDKLEVIVLPVADVDRAKDFYTRIGFREDLDYADGTGFRVVHFTPPGSQCSIIVGAGISTAEPGSACTSSWTTSRRPGPTWWAAVSR